MTLSSKHILITAGPTQEPLDPIRYLSNHSSGEMGLSLAAAFKKMGARVTLILGPIDRPALRGVEIIRVTTAREMSAAVRRRLPAADAFVATAAVCDWRPATVHKNKLKKGAGLRLLKLARNPDILAEVGKWKGRRTLPVLIGFALETRDLEAQARRKLIRKNLDLVIGNSPDSFDSAHIRPLLIERGGAPKRLARVTKKALSSRLARWLADRLSTEKHR